MAITMDTRDRNFSDEELLLGLERLSDPEWKQLLEDLEDVVNDLGHKTPEGQLPIHIDGVTEPVGYIRAKVDMPDPYDERTPFRAEISLYLQNLEPGIIVQYCIGRYQLFEHPSLFWFDDNGGFARIRAQIAHVLAMAPQRP